MSRLTSFLLTLFWALGMALVIAGLAWDAIHHSLTNRHKQLMP